MALVLPFAALLSSPIAQAQTVIGPGSRTTVVNVTSGTTTVVGGTTINTGNAWQISRQMYVYASGGYQRAFSDRFDAWDGKLGLRWNW